MSEQTPYRLKAEQAFWELEKVSDINLLDKEELLVIVKELDRRFIQLWDKIKFEREHALIDYTKLKDNNEK